MHHHRIVFRQTVEPRLGVARAGTRGGGAYGFEAEAGMVQHHGHLAVLVEAGGQAERVGEIDAHHIRFQNGVGVVEHQLFGEQQRRDVLDDVAELDHLIVCLIGAVVEHEVRFDDVLVAEGEQIGGGFVDGVVPEAFRNVSHTAYCLTLGPVRLGDSCLGELGKGRTACRGARRRRLGRRYMNRDAPGIRRDSPLSNALGRVVGRELSR